MEVVASPLVKRLFRLGLQHVKELISDYILPVYNERNNIVRHFELLYFRKIIHMAPKTSRKVSYSNDTNIEG